MPGVHPVSGAPVAGTVTEEAAGGAQEIAFTSTGRGLTAVAVQVAGPLVGVGPDADVTVDGWVTEDGSFVDLYESLNEEAADDADFIKAPLTDEPIILVSWTPS